MLPIMTEKPELTAFARRLNQLCDEQGIAPKFHGRQHAVAKRFGITQKGVRRWLEGEGWPDWEQLIALCDWGGCSLEWLIRGVGPKSPAPAGDGNPYIAHVVERMAAMTADQQALVTRLVDSVLPPESDG